MNDIINDVNELKENILKSSEYLNFKNSEKKFDNNKEVNSIIARIKKLQQTIINKEDKQIDSNKEEVELQSLYKELETFSDYIEYKKNARIFNNLITSIQKEFEEYFNSFIL